MKEVLGGAISNPTTMAGGERAVQRETLKAFDLSQWQVSTPPAAGLSPTMAVESQTSEKTAELQTERRYSELHDMLTLAFDELDTLAPSQDNLKAAKGYVRDAHRILRQIDKERAEMVPIRFLGSTVAMTPEEERSMAARVRARHSEL